MSDKGWLKLHRKIQDNPMWLSEPFTRSQAWIDLTIMANFRAGHVRVRGRRIEVPVGCVARSQNTLATRWKWSRGKVIRFLSELELDDQIVQETSHDFNIITICNYSEYQEGDTRVDTPDDTRNGTVPVHETGHETVHIKEQQKQQECKELLLQREAEKPETPLAWCGVFVSCFGYQMQSVQTAKAMPMFRQWVDKKITVGEVSEAMGIAVTRNGEQPNSPVFLDGILTDLRKPRAPSPAGTARPMSKHGDFGKRDYAGDAALSKYNVAGVDS